MTKGPSHAPSHTRSAAATGLILSIALAGGAAPAHAGATLWGYGVKSCKEFLSASPNAGTPDFVAGPEYRGYREWLAGLVSGLNLATGTDVLAGAELDAAMTRIRALCQKRPDDDYFNASMSLIRSLGQIGGKTGKAKKN